MGRKSRLKAERKTTARRQPILVLWSYPGAGKSYFARWLVEQKGFEHIDTDQLNNKLLRSPLEEAWWRAINGRAPASTFVEAAAHHGQPIVTEYGVWGRPDTVALLHELQQQGAMVCWFDADRDAAFAAWKAENRRLGRPFADSLWSQVVASINQHWAVLAAIFGTRRVRTLDAGPIYMKPEDIHAVIFGRD
jgi:hypothetical protein